MIEVQLPDDSSLEVKENSTVEDVAYQIGKGLGEDTVAGKITANWSQRRKKSQTETR